MQTFSWKNFTLALDIFEHFTVDLQMIYISYGMELSLT